MRFVTQRTQPQWRSWPIPQHSATPQRLAFFFMQVRNQPRCSQCRSQSLNVNTALIRRVCLHSSVAEKIQVVPICLRSAARNHKCCCGVCGWVKKIRSTRHFFGCVKSLCCVTKCWKKRITGELERDSASLTRGPLRYV